MSKIFCIVGKSSSGKDTVYKEILEKYNEEIIPVVLYTTRPKRKGETDGIDYHFVTDDELREMEASGKIIEKRQYNTTQGIWTYFTVKFELDSEKNYLLINTLEGARSMTQYYGEGVVKVIYLSVDDKTRLLRYIERESRQIKPDYSEVCRRFIADQQDFSEEKLNEITNLYTIDSSVSPKETLMQWEKIYIKLKEKME